MNFKSNLKSNFYQFFHSSLWKLNLFVPLSGIFLFLSYYSISIVDDYNKLSAYIQVLSVSFPFLIGIITSIVAENEKSAGNFQLLLSLPTKKYISHFAKLVILILFGFLSATLALVGFGIGFEIDFSKINDTAFPNLFYFKTAMLLSFSVLPLYVLQYIVSFFCGKGMCLGLGIVGSLVSTLLLTGLGERIWYLNPWGIAGRFSHTLLTSNVENIDFMNDNGIVESIVFVLISLVLLLTLLIILSNRWDGRNSED